MIHVTRINGSPFVLNARLIKFVEETPDTIVTLESGEKLLVKESADDIVAKVVDFVRLTRLVPDSSPGIQ